MSIYIKKFLKLDIKSRCMYFRQKMKHFWKNIIKFGKMLAITSKKIKQLKN